MATKLNSHQVMHQIHLKSITKEEEKNPMFFIFSSLKIQFYFPLNAPIPTNNAQRQYAAYDSR